MNHDQHLRTLRPSFLTGEGADWELSRVGTELFVIGLSPYLPKGFFSKN